MAKQTTTAKVTFAAYRKAIHGGYGQELARVQVDVEVDEGGFFVSDRESYAKGLAALRVLLPTQKIMVNVVDF